MIQLYLTSNCDLYKKLYSICSEYISPTTPILKTEMGKPFFEGNPVYFNISHSKERAAIAICNSPVGVDLEVFKNRIPSNIFSEGVNIDENIESENDFLTYWTKLESFVKKNGWSIFKEIKKFTFTGGDLYYNKIKQPSNFFKIEKPYGIVTICTDSTLNDIIVHENL
jgi:4'-phosphopantetheinyl transferase